MRALVFDGREVRLTGNHPGATPAPGEAVIRPLRVGVSTIDVEICRGLFGFTGVLGHEFVGVVESVAGHDRHPLKGRRVVGSGLAWCGRCDLCRGGLRGHCRQRTVLGQHRRDGCLSDRFALPAENLLPVPDRIDDDRAVFVQAVAAALQATRQVPSAGRCFVTILGDGPLGLLTAQIMSRSNTSVRLIGRHPRKLALCERWGIKHRHAEEMGLRADQDVVVECTGTPEGLALALQLVRPRGTIVLKSLWGTRPAAGASDLTPLVTGEITLRGSGAGDVAEAIGLIERQEVDVVSLLGRRMRLDDGPAVLHAASEAGALKVLVDL